jgi:hypothetical protein
MGLQVDSMKTFFARPTAQKTFSLYLLGALVGCLGVVYGRTMLPVVGFGSEWAKFDFIGQVLGTPHFSGYPTYVMLNALFVRLFPFGSLAVRAHLLSAIFAVAASGFVYATLGLLRVRLPLAFASALAFGLTYSMWAYSLVAEVYTLYGLFAAAIIYFLLRWRQQCQPRYLNTAGLLMGLALGNQLAIIGLLPAFIYLVWVTERPIFRQPRRMGLALAFALLGLAQYAYIFWRANAGDARFVEMTIAQGWQMLTRPPLSGGFLLTPYEILQRVPVYFSYLWREYLVLLPLSLWGIWVMFRRPEVRHPRDFRPAFDHASAVFLLLALAGNTLVALPLRVEEQQAYFIPTYIVLAISLGVALDWVMDLFKRWPEVVMFGLLAPAILLGMNFRDVDQSRHVDHAVIVERALLAVEPNAIIVVDGEDYANYFWYYLLGEQRGQGEKFAYPITDGGVEGLRAYIDQGQPVWVEQLRQATPLRRPVYALWPLKGELEAAGFALEPMDGGRLFRVK